MGFNSGFKGLNLIGQANSPLHLAVLTRADMASKDLSGRLVKRRPNTTSYHNL